MFSAVVFALLSVASATDVYANARVGVNPAVHQGLVPALSHNAAFVGQHVVPQAYGVGYGVSQKVVAPHAYGVGYGRAQKVVAPHAYAAKYADATSQRDFGIERVGERYAIQSGPSTFQYSFLKGADLGGHHAAAPIGHAGVAFAAQPAVHGYAKQVAYAQPAIHGYAKQVAYAQPAVHGYAKQVAFAQPAVEHFGSFGIPHENRYDVGHHQVAVNPVGGYVQKDLIASS